MPIPIAPIFKANSLPQLVTRVMEMIDVLNHPAGWLAAGNNITFTTTANTLTIAALSSDFGDVVVNAVSNTVSTITFLTEQQAIANLINANNASFLDGLPGSYYSNAANLIGMAPLANSALFANNASFLNGQPGSFYNNAVNLFGLVPVGSLPIANTTVNGAVSTIAQSFAGVKTFTANTEYSGYVNVATTLQVAGVTSLATMNANGSLGSNNQVLTSNGGPVFWTTPATTKSNRWYAFTAMTLPEFGLSPQPGTADWLWSHGIGSPGAVSGVTDSEGYFTRYTMSPWYAFGISSRCMWIVANNSNPHCRLDQNPYLRWVIRTGSDVSNTRIWMTLTNADLNYISVPGDTALTKGVGVTYSTSRGDTGWRTWYSDGVTQTLGTVFTPLIVSTRYVVEINVLAGQCTVSINGVMSPSFTVPPSIMTTGMYSDFTFWNLGPDGTGTPSTPVPTFFDIESIYGERD